MLCISVVVICAVFLGDMCCVCICAVCLCAAAVLKQLTLPPPRCLIVFCGHTFDCTAMCVCVVSSCVCCILVSVCC